MKIIYQNVKEHELENTLTMLKDLKNYLETNSLGDNHLSNLPCHIWETLGECINNIDSYIHGK